MAKRKKERWSYNAGERGRNWARAFCDGSAPRENRVYGEDKREQQNYDAAGRWPANVVLSHHPECEPIGSRTVRSDGHYPGRRGAGGIGTNGHGGQDSLNERYTAGESVEVWDCHA